MRWVWKKLKIDWKSVPFCRVMVAIVRTQTSVTVATNAISQSDGRTSLNGSDITGRQLMPPLFSRLLNWFLNWGKYEW
jgi:hypothetical protein